MKRKAIIFGIKGTSLTTSERHLFKSIKPWGMILFSRNIKSYYQNFNLFYIPQYQNKTPLRIELKTTV